MDDLEAQGFIKHDGGGMPDCYEPDDFVDTCFATGGSLDRLRCAAVRNWHGVTHHRRHISEREQIAMAIEALDAARPYMLAQANNYTFPEDHTENNLVQATLKILKERRP